MKHKILSLAVVAAMASATLISCQQADEPAPAPEIDNGDLVEYTIAVNVPDEMRTRAGQIGDSGLFEFVPRTIDKLWYAIYYDGEYKKESTVTRTDEKPFTVVEKLSYAKDPTKLFFFFWAGNQNDPIWVTSGNKIDETDICLNYLQKYVYINPSLLNSSTKNLNYVYDSFAGYYPFSEEKTNELRASFTLKRPFAEIHILTDEFIQSDLGTFYSSGISSTAGFGNEIISNDNLKDNISFPSRWNFDDNDSPFEFNNILTEQSAGSGLYDTSFKFKNSLKGDAPFRTTFKGREMDYLNCFYCFAPKTKNPFSGNQYLNFVTTGTSQRYGFNSEFTSVALPEEGLQANYKYVIYNKQRSEGGTGFLTPVYTITAIPDMDWDGTEQSENGENRVTE